MSASERFARLPTAAKLLLILTAALLPLGLALAWTARISVDDVNAANLEAAEQQGRGAARAIESLIARNALALRVAANGAFQDRRANPCEATARSLALTPAIANRFVIRRPDGTPLCTHGDIVPTRSDMLVAPGDIRLWVTAPHRRVDYRVGVIGGIATGELNADELRSEIGEPAKQMLAVSISDGTNDFKLIDNQRGLKPDREILERTYSIGAGQLTVRIGTTVRRATVFDQAALFLPLVMWIVAALVSWLLVRQLLIRPLDKLKRAVIAYEPGEEQLQLPQSFGTTAEIRELGFAFERAVDRIEQSERQMAEALEGQRRLVREVHHRVKNNLQVVASLLNIHSRSAASPDVRAAYAAISRRVGALSVVHRNHFADVEESRGIALRPLLTELAAELRVSAPEAARSLALDLDLDTVNTTQDVAVAVAFLVTEIVEFAMLRAPDKPVEIALRRTSELTARLDLGSAVLTGEEAADPEHQQFERIVTGLAKQLRSTLERKLGRYSVEFPVFPPN
jgi:two-component sensor histidine kinase